MKVKILLITAFLVFPVLTFAQGSYKQPPKEVMDVLNAPPIPFTSVSPAGDRIALLVPLRYPPISELAQPMLRIAGLRINPNTNALHRQNYFTKLTLKNVGDGKETPVAVPADAKLITPEWSPDGKSLAVGNITATGIDLWIVEAASGKARKINGVHLNNTMGRFGWEDSHTISAMLVSTKRGPAPPYQNITPTEPDIQETSGRTGAVQTFEDLLKSPLGNGIQPDIRFECRRNPPTGPMLIGKFDPFFATCQTSMQAGF